VNSVTSRATIHNTAFSECQTPAFIRETEGSCSSSRVREAVVLRVVPVVFMRVQVRVRNGEFTTSSQSVIEELLA
jgi:hypothetical protein